ncbi:hypothetical protein Salat_2650500 [Sesamum alatum]|uniref:Myb/SANT-like domain-containing protein n=1 Tax=Sesamum alatum TaxID=300844 RepID=A0AAE2CAY4_9LAMI|nr:hypothetical protein Salat_2650500 [Sesamum alatum]
MVFQDEYFHQRRLFYSTKWSKDMEATFVDSLVQHKKHGNFNRNGINFHAVICPIYDVNQEHSTKHSYTTGDNKLRKLKERYAVFSWILNVSCVFMNKVARYVLADDAFWEMIIEVNNNLFEYLYESHCFLFDSDNPDEQTLVIEEEEVDSIASFALPQEKYYTFDDEDKVDSLLALPAAPPPSPDPSYASVEHTSSSASNEINKSE